jgi:hypothetical protein
MFLPEEITKFPQIYIGASCSRRKRKTLEEKDADVSSGELLTHDNLPLLLMM